MNLAEVGLRERELLMKNLITKKDILIFLTFFFLQTGYEAYSKVHGMNILNHELNTTVMVIMPSGNLCSGVIISKHGHILTCAHCLMKMHGSMVTIRFYDGWMMGGRVILVDPDKDLALVYLDRPFSETFTYSQLARSGNHLTEFVRVIGHPLGLPWTVTEGIVSGEDRMGLSQTDAVVNPGNSGGPVFDEKGRLMGIAEAIISPYDAPFYTGQGLFIPVDKIKKFLNLVNLGMGYA